MTPDVFPKFPFLSYSKLQFDTLEELWREAVIVFSSLKYYFPPINVKLSESSSKIILGAPSTSELGGQQPKYEPFVKMLQCVTIHCISMVFRCQVKIFSFIQTSSSQHRFLQAYFSVEAMVVSCTSFCSWHKLCSLSVILSGEWYIICNLLYHLCKNIMMHLSHLAFPIKPDQAGVAAVDHTKHLPTTLK